MAVAREGNVGNDIEMVGLQLLHVSQAELAIVFSVRWELRCLTFVRNIFII